MHVYLCGKFEGSSIILTSIRPGVRNFTPHSSNLKTNL